VIEVEGGAVTLIDESYNANPASMRAALTLLGEAPIGRRGRRVAVLGDMLELGSESPQLHAALAGPVLEAGIDRVFAAGPLMRRLWEALPVETRGYRAETAAELQDPLLAALRPGDAVMVKGSLGSRMGPLVEALKSRYAARSQTQDA
jgi:UDP-N-acetylmuramyl pentapeptide synthase